MNRRPAGRRTPPAVPAFRPPEARRWRWFEALVESLTPPRAATPPAESGGPGRRGLTRTPIDARELSPWGPFSMRF